MIKTLVAQSCPTCGQFTEMLVDLVLAAASYRCESCGDSVAITQYDRQRFKDLVGAAERTERSYRLAVNRARASARNSAQEK